MIPTPYILPELHLSTITHTIPKEIGKIQPDTSNEFPHTNAICPKPRFCTPTTPIPILCLYDPSPKVIILQTIMPQPFA